jgi:ribosomal protein S18 acetylase RimI-like enzyme
MTKVHGEYDGDEGPKDTGPVNSGSGRRGFVRFELTEALIDDILFSMEDQMGDFMIDAQEGVIVRGPEGPPEEGGRFIPLPAWDSSDGYRLMERFAAGFKNSLIREKLTGALDKGRGVFRAFKDVLGGHPEVERRWFSFKDREMKRKILSWYNALREEWGLEWIGREPEETGDLVFEDFHFREPLPEDAARAAELHSLCIEEYRGAEKTGTWEGPPDFAADLPGAVMLVAETGGGDFAAYIAALREGGSLRITALEVLPEYRGLGLGEALLTRFCGALDGEQVILDLPIKAEVFSRVLLRNSFRPFMTRYVLIPRPYLE